MRCDMWDVRHHWSSASWTERLRGKQQCHSRTDTRRLDLPIGLESLQRGSDPNRRNGRDPAVDQEVCPDHVRRLVRSPAAKIKQWLAFARCPIRVAQGIGNVLWPMTFRGREAKRAGLQTVEDCGTDGATFSER